nr:YopT-type cysteine protease domain-containing protein [Marinibactrum halimedae]
MAKKGLCMALSAMYIHELSCGSHLSKKLLGGWTEGKDLEGGRKIFSNYWYLRAVRQKFNNWFEDQDNRMIKWMESQGKLIKDDNFSQFKVDTDTKNNPSVDKVIEILDQVHQEVGYIMLGYNYIRNGHEVAFCFNHLTNDWLFFDPNYGEFKFTSFDNLKGFMREIFKFNAGDGVLNDAVKSLDLVFFKKRKA